MTWINQILLVRFICSVHNLHKCGSVLTPTSCLLFLFQVSAFLLEFMFWKAVDTGHPSIRTSDLNHPFH